MEFLVQQSYTLTKDMEGEAQMSEWFRDAQALTSGKATWQLFSAFLADSPTLRAEGWMGAAVNGYCFDRGCFSSLARLTRQYHKYWHETNAPNDALLQLLDIVCIRADALRNMMNGWFRSMMPHTTDKDADYFKILFKLIRSLRNVYDLIHQYLYLVQS